MTSLIGFDYSTSVVNRLQRPLITPAELRERLKICEEDESDIRQINRHIKSAISIIEKQTGIVISPRVVEMCFDEWPCGEIPLPFAPVWDDDQLGRYRNMYCECGTADERCFADCLPECLAVETWSKKRKCYRPINTCKYFLDSKRKPNALKLESCFDCWGCDPCGRPIKVTFVAGYACTSQIEAECPELLEAILMTATDFYDCLSMAEILSRQGPFWSMLGHAC